MHDIELELAHERISECAGMPSRGLNTDENFPVLKGEHVSRARLPEKLPMQQRHPSIGNKRHEHFPQLAQVSSLLLPQLQTILHGLCRKPLEFANIDEELSLKIANADLWHGIASCQLPIANLSFCVLSLLQMIHV